MAIVIILLYEIFLPCPRNPPPCLAWCYAWKEKMDHLAILEVLPSCVWISSSMCLHLCCLNFLQLLLVLNYGPNHCFTSLSHPSIPRCPIASSSSRIFLSISRTEPVLKHYSIVKCTNFPFLRVLLRPKLIPNKRVVSILSQRCNLFRISERAASKVFAISPCTGLQIHWSWMRWNGNFMELLNINFLFLVHLCPCAKFDENSGACSRTLEVLMNLISSLITNSWECFVIPAKQFKCTIYPQGDSRE